MTTEEKRTVKRLRRATQKYSICLLCNKDIWYEEEATTIRLFRRKREDSDAAIQGSLCTDCDDIVIEKFPSFSPHFLLPKEECKWLNTTHCCYNHDSEEDLQRKYDEEERRFQQIISRRKLSNGDDDDNN